MKDENDENIVWPPLLNSGVPIGENTNGTPRIDPEQACALFNPIHFKTYLKLGDVNQDGTFNKTFYLTGDELISEEMTQ